MTFLKKHDKWIVGALGILGFVGAILLLFVAAPHADAGYKRSMDIVIGLLALVLFGLCLAYILLSRDTEPHFFLFDRVKKKNIPANKLTFVMINERLSFLETNVCDSTEELWSRNILETAALGYHGVYRPLLAFKMIYDLADRDVESEWERLYNVSPLVLAALCRALEQGDAADFAKTFFSMVDRCQKQTDPTRRREFEDSLRKFVCSNTNYLRGRIVGYIKKNLEYFY